MDDNLLFYILTGFLGAELVKKIQNREIILPDFLITCIVFFCLQALLILFMVFLVIFIFIDENHLNFNLINYEIAFLYPLGFSIVVYFSLKLLRLFKNIRKN